MAEIMITTKDDSRFFLEPDTAVSSADLTEEERGRYRELLTDIDRLERIEDEQVAKNISLATDSTKEWQLL